MKKKTLKTLYRAAYAIGMLSLITSFALGISLANVGTASAQADKVEWCHCGPNHCNTINVSQAALENAGHVDAQGNILHSGDHPGACEEEEEEQPTATPVPDPTATPSGDGDGDGDGDTSTSAAGGEILIPVTGVADFEGAETASVLLRDAGFVMIGLGMALHGIALSKEED